MKKWIFASLIRSKEPLFQTQQWQDRPQVSSARGSICDAIDRGRKYKWWCRFFPEILVSWLTLASNQSNDEAGWIEEAIALLSLQLIVMEGIVSIGFLAYFISGLISKPIEEIHDIIASINEENIETKRLIIPKKMTSLRLCPNNSTSY